MSRWSAEQYAAWCAKSTPPPKQAPLIPSEDDLEGELHDMIIAWCRRQDPQVPYIHNRTDKKSTATKGAPDFVLLLPGGKTLLVECKRSDGKLSEDQQQFASMASGCGHAVHVVRSYDQFLALTKGTGQ